jgi:MYXO-CTERM domain-containing protein
MPSVRELLERERQTVDLERGHFERLTRRRDRKRRNRQIGAAVLTIVIALLSVTGIVRVFGNSERPANEPTPTPVDRGIFSGMGGWIAYNNTSGSGIWAMDPGRPSDPHAQIHLTSHPGEPLAWSSDGSKLLILTRSGHALSVLNADGSETLLFDAGGPPLLSGGSFSPDGSKVVYAYGLSDSSSGIYVVDAGGGTPRRLLSARGLPALSGATFSPDGSQIAYFQGWGDHDNTLRVMNPDGSGSRVLLKDAGVTRAPVVSGPIWSPDGRRLAFVTGYPDRIYVVGADGSGLTRAIADGGHPEWSSDGSRIAYDGGGHLVIADADGTHVQRFDYARSGPWNPLDRAESGTRDTSATAGATRPDSLTYAIAALAAIGVAALWLRRKRKKDDVR